MNLLFTGKGTSGSWIIRGQQLGTACGATVMKRADFKTMSQHDVIVVVKRVSDEMLQNLERSSRPWIWDTVDAWPQPEGNRWSRPQCVNWLKAEIRRLRPAGIIFPTLRMWEDSEYTGPATVLPHHANPAYCAYTQSSRAEPREQVRVVGYEGAEHYLGRWASIVNDECQRRGWRFVVNGDLRQADIGVALRDFEGHAAKHWKSNVKLANLQALGLPTVCSPESGYVQYGSNTEHWAVEASDIVRAFNAFSDYAYRRSVRERMLQATITQGRVRHELLRWLKVSKFC